MFWRSGKKGGAEPSVPAPAGKPDATDGFPRGLPDGDLNKPVALGRWPSTAEIGRLLPEWQPGMFLLGRDAAGRYFGHQDDRHVLTVAGSRAGKGVSLIVPNLCYWLGSVIAIDPKGELATLTASRRSAEGSDWSAPLTPGEGEVYALDPFDRVTGPAREFAKHAAYNPMANLDPTTGPGQDLAYQLADALIVQSDGDGAHWTQSARSVLRGVILFVAATEEPDGKNLITVRRLLTEGDAASGRLWHRMAALGKGGELFDLIARTGEVMKGRGAGERGSILSGIEAQTAFLEGPEMRRVLSNSSFALEDLKARRVTVYLCLPATRLATHGRWLRMIVSLAMDAMERTGPLKNGQHPVLFCLDEFAALGRMEMVEKAAGQIASFGVKLWPVVQDITQLQRDYRESWETFMGNAGILTFHGNTDLSTTQHIAERLGQTETLRTTQQRTVGSSTHATGAHVDPVAVFLSGGTGAPALGGGIVQQDATAQNESLHVAPLMQASEIVQAFSREKKKLLVMVPNLGPIALYRCEYFCLEDKALFDRRIDPRPGEPIPQKTR